MKPHRYIGYDDKKNCSEFVEVKNKEHSSYVPSKTETMQNFKAIFSMFLCG